MEELVLEMEKKLECMTHLSELVDFFCSGILSRPIIFIFLILIHTQATTQASRENRYRLMRRAHQIRKAVEIEESDVFAKAFD